MKQSLFGAPFCGGRDTFGSWRESSSGSSKLGDVQGFLYSQHGNIRFSRVLIKSPSIEEKSH